MSGNLMGNVVEVHKGAETVYYYTFLPESIVAEYGLPSSLIVGIIDNPESSSESLENVIKSSLKVNVEFKKTIQNFCENVLSKMPQIEIQANAQGNGWVYIIDQRTPDPAGEVPSQDIFGAFEISDGKVVRYQANPSYEIYSANGFINFGPLINSDFESYMVGIVENKK